MRILILAMLVLLAGCGGSAPDTKNVGPGQPEPHNEGVGETVADVIRYMAPIQTAWAQGGDIHYGDYVRWVGGLGWLKVHVDSFPSHPFPVSSADYYGFCFHEDTGDSTNTGLYWSDGSSWHGPLGTGTGDVGGAGAWVDEQLLMGDGTGNIQGIPGWSGTGSSLKNWDFSSTSDVILNTALTGDSGSRFQIWADGTLAYGNGTVLGLTISRAGTDLSINQSNGLRWTEIGAGGNYFQIGIVGDRATTQSVFWPDDSPSDGDFLEWNTGGQLEWTAAGGGFTGISLAGDIGTPQTLNDTDTLSVLGGTALQSTVSATDTVTLNYNGAISDNSDVDTSGVATDDALIYDGADWVDQKTYYTTSFTSSGWTNAGGPLYYQTFTHNLGKKFVNIQVYDPSDLQKIITLSPASTGDLIRIVATSTTQCTIWIYNGNAISGTWNLVCTR